MLLAKNISDIISEADGIHWFWLAIVILLIYQYIVKVKKNLSHGVIIIDSVNLFPIKPYSFIHFNINF